MPDYQAAIFDLDGLLIDTERLSIAAGRKALTELDLPPADLLFERLVGKDMKTVLQMVTDHFAPHVTRSVSFAPFLDRWEELFHEELQAGIPLRPGADTLLGRLRDRGLPLALATSSSHAGAHRKLNQTGLIRYFDAVVSVDCVENPKPAPDPYLLAARRLGRDPRFCIAFEDSDTGAAAARAAGMTVVQVPDMVPTGGPHAHHLAADLMSGAALAGLI